MKKILILIAVLAVLGAGWYFASPLFITNEVNEEFPEVSTEPTQMDVLNELGIELPEGDDLTSMTSEQMAALEREVVEKSAGIPDVVVEDVMEPTGPVLLSSGSFADADSFHKGSGKAGVYSLEDGSRVLRFENFEVTNGPDLRVLLTSSTDSVDDGYVELGKLKGNKGDQNYSIPADVNLDDFGAVVIYCKPFHVIFSTASLN